MRAAEELIGPEKKEGRDLSNEHRCRTGVVKGYRKTGGTHRAEESSSFTCHHDNSHGAVLSITCAIGNFTAQKTKIKTT